MSTQPSHSISFSHIFNVQALVIVHSSCFYNSSLTYTAPSTIPSPLYRMPCGFLCFQLRLTFLTWHMQLCLTWPVFLSCLTSCDSLHCSLPSHPHKLLRKSEFLVVQWKVPCPLTGSFFSCFEHLTSVLHQATFLLIPKGLCFYPAVLVFSFSTFLLYMEHLSSTWYISTIASIFMRVGRYIPFTCIVPAVCSN